MPETGKTDKETDYRKMLGFFCWDTPDFLARADMARFYRTQRTLKKLQQEIDPSGSIWNSYAPKNYQVKPLSSLNIKTPSSPQIETVQPDKETNYRNMLSQFCWDTPDFLATADMARFYRTQRTLKKLREEIDPNGSIWNSYAPKNYRVQPLASSGIKIMPTIHIPKAH